MKNVCVLFFISSIILGGELYILIGEDEILLNALVDDYLLLHFLWPEMRAY